MLNKGPCIFVLHGTLKITELTQVLKFNEKVMPLEFLFRGSFQVKSWLEMRAGQLVLTLHLNNNNNNNNKKNTLTVLTMRQSWV